MICCVRQSVIILYLCLSVSPPQPLPVCVCLSVFLPLSLTISFSRSLSHCFSLSLPVYLSPLIYPCFCLSVSLPYLFLSVCLSPFPISSCLFVPISLSLSVYLPPCLSLSPSVLLPLHLPLSLTAPPPPPSLTLSKSGRPPCVRVDSPVSRSVFLTRWTRSRAIWTPTPFTSYWFGAASDDRTRCTVIEQQDLTEHLRREHGCYSGVFSVSFKSVRELA